MDFILSKVAMSVAALLVVAVVGGMFEEGALLDSRGELESMCRMLSSLADQVAMNGAEGTVDWQVPFASGGEKIRMTVDGVLIRAESASEKAIVQSATEIRTWVHDGAPMNSSKLLELDKASSPLATSSGDTITLASRTVMLDNQVHRMVFAETAG